MDPSVLSSYIHKFQHLHTDKNPNYYTAGKAPHKPVLLLALILLNKNKKVDLSNIHPDIYLRETWSQLWKCLEYNKTGPIHMPLYHLRSEGFWHLSFNNVQTQPKSLESFNNMVKGISIDRDLIDLLNDEESRNALINALLNGGYFSQNEINKLVAGIKELDASFSYEQQLLSLMKQEFEVHPKTDPVFALARDPAFRRIILNIYDETCAVCGMRIIISSGIAMIDAAHILPFSQFQNDDARNGLALCKTHHWLFDKGLMTVDGHYRVKVSKTIEEERPEAIITNFEGKDLKLPSESTKYPSPIALEWHRENVFERK